MKKIAIMVMVLIGVFGLYYLLPQNPKADNKEDLIENQERIQTSRQKQLETRTDDQANVTVEITPIDVSADSPEWKFKLSINTHSVDLNNDIMKSATLIDDKGEDHPPVSWSGVFGGHHMEGELNFHSINPAPASFQIKISGVGGVDRSFFW